MNKTTAQALPDEKKWISTSVGCPRKEIHKVLVRLSNGKIGYATYVNREKKWYTLSKKTVLTTVVAWKLADDSLIPVETEQSKP